MRLRAFLEHQAARRADQARVGLLSDLVFASTFALVVLAALFV